MKKNVIKTVFAAVCVFAAGMGGMKAYNTANQSEADLLLAENVESLSQNEPGKSITYSWSHMDCGDWVWYKDQLNFISNGKHKGFCWENPNASRGYHSHNCSNCNDNG